MEMQLIPKLNTLKLSPGVHIYNQPICLDTQSSLCGDSKESTVIKFRGDFLGPCIRSKNLENLVGTNKWFYEDGVPVRMSLANLTLDFSEWNPKHDKNNIFSKLFSSTGNYDVGKFGVALYAKKYEVNNIAIRNCPKHGFYSSCSNVGGKKDFYYDSP